jgi:hypothetical protein
MAFVHGRLTAVLIGANDMSQYSNSVEFARSADTHDVTTFGVADKVYRGGLRDGEVSIEGFYDTTATTGPSDVFVPLLGTTAVLKYRPEGTGAALPESEVTIVVKEYAETSPVGDMVTWSVSAQMSGAVDVTAQP